MTPENPYHSTQPYLNAQFRADNGFALFAAMIFVTIVGLMGTSILIATSTEISISGNYRRGIEAFYLAEAGIEEARARLRGSLSRTQGFIGDPGWEPDAQWAAYILTASDWTPNEDESFSSRFTNYVPTMNSQTNSAIVSNSLQSAMPYWVKIHHKAEYDAEKSGHSFDHPHYVDHDGNLDRHTLENRGNVIFYGYPTKDSVRPIDFTTTGATDSFPVELVTAHGSLKGGSVIVEVEVTHDPGPRVLGALYAGQGISLAGSSSVLSGEDRCGAVPSTAPVYTPIPSVTRGNAVFQGNPPEPLQGPLEIDLRAAIESLKRGAHVLTTDQMSGAMGNSNHPKTMYADMRSPEGGGLLTIQNLNGFGILLAEGPVLIQGPLNWQGLMVITDRLTLDASTGLIRIFGGVWSQQVQHLAGEITITYDSCAIKASLLSQPLTITQWRQGM